MAPSKSQLETMAKEFTALGLDGQSKFVGELIKKMTSVHSDWQPIFSKSSLQLSFPLNDSDPKFKELVEHVRGKFEQSVKSALAGDDAGFKKDLNKLADRHVKYGVEQDKFQAVKPLLGDVVKATVPRADVGAWKETIGHVLDNIVKS